MQPTRRFWESIAVAGTLCAAALVYAQPLLLLAPAGIAAWLLASQLGFVYAVGRLDETLTVTQTFDRTATVTGDPVTATLEATGDDAGLHTTVTTRPSAGLDATGDRQISLGESTSFTLETDIAGTHHLEPPEFTVRDAAGLFTERFARGPQTELVVEARQPQNVHIGEGGNSIPIAFGHHALDATGTGVSPAELREYNSADPAARIDWKTTARLSTPYVREFEAESDQTTLLIVDARSNLNVGIPGETALDYLRTVALSHVAIAQRLDDPIGYFGITDRGIQRLTTPTNAARGYELARRRLRTVTADPGPSRARTPPPIQRRTGRYDPGTRFGEILEAYASARPTVDAETKPLKAAVRQALITTSGTTRIVLFTDDSDRAGIREAVSEARRSEHPLDIFLAPTVLYETDTFADLTRANERYRDFEEFRRTLVEIDGVSAYEVAPEGRIEIVLERQQAVVGQ